MLENKGNEEMPMTMTARGAAGRGRGTAGRGAAARMTQQGAAVSSKTGMGMDG